MRDTIRGGWGGLLLSGVEQYRVVFTTKELD